MSELDALRQVAPTLILALFTSVILLVRSLSNRLTSRTVEFEEMRNKYHQESSDHQTTKNKLTVVQTTLEITSTAKEKLETREETYRELIDGLNRDIATYRSDFQKQMTKMEADFQLQFEKQRLDFDAEINALKVKHQEFITNRDLEIKAKSEEILRLEQEAIDQANKHLAEINKQKAQHEDTMKLKDDELKDYQKRLELAETKIANLSNQLDELAKRVETQTLKPIPITSDES